MKKYYDVYGDEFTAADLLAEAKSYLNELADSVDGTQMHRRAVVGKKLTVHLHGVSGEYYRGHPVTIRVEGQYTDQAYRKLDTREYAQPLLDELNHLIGLNPIGLVK